MVGNAVLRAWHCLTPVCPVGPAPADPDGLHYPPYEPLVNGRLITIGVIRVNGATAPGRPLQEAVTSFSRHVAGEVKMVENRSVEIEADTNGLLTTGQLDPFIADRTHRGTSHITVVLAPRLSDLRSAGHCALQPGGSHVILLQAKCVDDVVPPPAAVGLPRRRGPFLLAMRAIVILLASREKRWYLALKHELLHALCLPYDRSHVLGPHHHCTHPECLLYGRFDIRSVLGAILRLGIPNDLCRVCQREIRRVREAAGRLIDYEPTCGRMEWLRALVRLNPCSARAYGLRASAHHDQGNYEDAVLDLTKAIELSPGDPIEYMYRAQAHWQQANHEKAIHDLTKAIELDPKTKTIMCHRNRGVLFARLGQYESAISDWERCLQLRPDDSQALHNLARVLATCPDDGIRNGPHAVELAQRGCELAKWQTASELDTLAAAYAETGQFERAVDYQRRALSLADEQVINDYQHRLELYCDGKPCRDLAP